MTSREKLLALLTEYTAPPGPDSGPVELAMRSMLRMPFIGGAIRDQLPEDPRAVDELLEFGARQLLQLRSDDAPELVTVSVLIEDPPPYELPAAGG